MNITLQPCGETLQMAPGERILDAAQRLGYGCPHSCRNGNCHACGAVLLQGRVRQGGVELTEGELFTCLAEPLEDCVLHWSGVQPPGQLPVRELSCQLIDCQALGADIYRVRLLAPAGRAVRYYAGQYLLLQREDGEYSAFSLACAPHAGRQLELHIQARDPGTQGLVAYLQRQGMARVQLPFGDTHLATLPQRPLLLIAASTGMAQMQGLIEHCRAEGFKQPVHLYWGVRDPQDFYPLEHWQQWQGLANLHLHRVVSEPLNWGGRCGLLHEAVCADFSDLSRFQVYISGSPAMVYGTLDALVEAGMAASQAHADVFAYAPR